MPPNTAPRALDGATFSLDSAAGALQTTDWLAVALSTAAEGGVGGRLVLSTDANGMADVAATTGTISDPGAATRRRPAPCSSSRRSRTARTSSGARASTPPSKEAHEDGRQVPFR